MKIRTEFVTNSSSSCYMCVKFSGKKLMEILGEYEDLIREMCDNAWICDGEFCFEDNECAYEEAPTTKSAITGSIIELVENLYWTGEEPKEEIEEIISQLQKHRNEINNTTTFLWETVEQGWGGDSESRIWHRYSDAYIRQYMGLPEDAPLTDEIIREFKNKALNATSQETTIVRYEGEQFEITKEFELI